MYLFFPFSPVGPLSTLSFMGNKSTKDKARQVDILSLYPPPTPNCSKLGWPLWKISSMLLKASPGPAALSFQVVLDLTTIPAEKRECRKT